MTTISIESTSIEPVLVDVTAHDDPTGSAPDFALTDVHATSPDGGWVAGEWVTGWSAGRITAQTPTIGATGAGLVIVEGLRYRLWMRWGSVVKRAATITAT